MSLGVLKTSKSVINTLFLSVKVLINFKLFTTTVYWDIIGFYYVDFIDTDYLGMRRLLMERNKLNADSLNIFETIALSVAIMGPSASVAITVAMMASFTGYSAPLILVISTIIVGLVAVSIVKLNQCFSSSGSVYYFVEKTLGKRAGFVSGWLIVFAYIMLGTSCAAVATSYLQGLFANYGIKLHWLFIIAGLLAIVWYLAYKDAETSTKIMLVLEVISMSLILILAIIIIIRAATTTGLSIAPFKAKGISVTGFATAAIFGFLAFSGFEGASSLGEESKNPQKTIPLAIAIGIIVTGVFYVFVSYAEVLGYGITPSGIAELTKSSAPIVDLMSKYISSGLSIVMLLCISISFFSSTLGCVTAGARILYTMSREGMLFKALSKTHRKYNNPYIGVNTLIIITTIIAFASFKLSAIAVGGYAAMTGSLALLVSYLITTLGAVIYFYKNKIWSPLNLVIPIIAVLALIIIFVLNLYPVPEYPMNIFPYIVIGWVIVGVLFSKYSTKNIL